MNAQEIEEYTDKLKADSDWSQWLKNLSGERVAPIYITHELNVMRAGAQAHPETAQIIRHYLHEQETKGLTYLHADGRIEIGDKLVGYWEA